MKLCMPLCGVISIHLGRVLLRGSTKLCCTRQTFALRTFIKSAVIIRLSSNFPKTFLRYPRCATSPSSLETPNCYFSVGNQMPYIPRFPMSSASKSIISGKCYDDGVQLTLLIHPIMRNYFMYFKPRYYVSTVTEHQYFTGFMLLNVGALSSYGNRR